MLALFPSILLVLVSSVVAQTNTTAPACGSQCLATTVLQQSQYAPGIANGDILALCSVKPFEDAVTTCIEMLCADLNQRNLALAFQKTICANAAAQAGANSTISTSSTLVSSSSVTSSLNATSTLATITPSSLPTLTSTMIMTMDINASTSADIESETSSTSPTGSTVLSFPTGMSGASFLARSSILIIVAAGFITLV